MLNIRQLYLGSFEDINIHDINTHTLYVVKIGIFKLISVKLNFYYSNLYLQYSNLDQVYLNNS